MSCGCQKIAKSPLWTPDPEYRQPTQIQPGENIDCYAKRAGSISGLKNDQGGKVPNLIDNTSLTSDLTGKVDTTFKLTPPSTRTATIWSISIDGGTGTSPLTELTFDESTGKLSGTVTEEHLNKSYNVLITASDDIGQIDSRSFTFFPKTSSDTANNNGAVKFIVPLTGGTAHVTCGYGPRTPPAAMASSFHHGLDFALTSHGQGTIVSAADGTVVKAGPATGFGNWIVIEHKDSSNALVATTVYGHMNNGNIFVSVGDKVASGQKIALEGNAGIGSGMHLHFELHKGKWKNPVDPAPYLSGQLDIADDNQTGADSTGSTTVGPDGSATPTTFSTQNNSNVGMTSAESSNANEGCPVELPNNPAPGDETPPNVTSNSGVPLAGCKPPDGQVPSVDEVKAKMNQAMDEDGTLDSTDRNFLMSVATFESSLNPYAKNPTSSATGLFQMLDSVAVHYYAQIGQPATCATRCDPYLATKAMIAFYKKEILPYYTGMVSSGYTKLAGKTITSTSWSAKYSSLTKSEFCYGCIFHDGVGNAVAGKDLGGVAYWRSKVGH